MSSAAAKKQRPKYLSLPAILFQIRMPLPAAGCRSCTGVSGALLVFRSRPGCLYLLDVSLASERGFAHIGEYLRMPLAKLGLLVLVWAYCHHFCAGLRYLLLDLNKGIELRPARISSGVVIVVEPRSHRVLRSQAVVSASSSAPITACATGSRSASLPSSWRCTASSLGLVLSRSPFTYESWRGLFSQGWWRIATLLFAISLAWHAWVGVRDILMDYIKHDGLRLALQVLSVLLLAGYVGWASRSSGDEFRPQIRCDRGRRGRLRHARGARARARQSARWRCSPRCSRRARIPWRHRAASRRRSPTRPRTTGTGTCTTRSRASDYLGDQDAIEYMCRARDRGGGRARAHGHAVRPARERPHLPAALRRPYAELRQPQDGDALVRRGRPHRPRDAAYALPAERARQHAVLRRVDGARSDPRSAGRGGGRRRRRWRWRPARS